MKKLLDADEVIVMQVKKTRSPILFLLIFLPIWLFFGVNFLWLFLKLPLTGFITFEPLPHFLAGLIALVVFAPVVILILHGLFLNRFILTDKHVIIQKGVPGTRYTIPLDSICAFQHVTSRGRNTTNHAIEFTLLSGKRLRTGDLHATLNSMEELLAALRDKFEGRGFTNAELRQIKEQNPGHPVPLKQPLKAARIILAAPFVLGLLLTVLYMSDANQLGKQQQVTLPAKVMEIGAKYDEHEDIVGYLLYIKLEGDDQIRPMTVDEETYVRTEAGATVTIEAERGWLGMLHDYEVK